MKHILKFSLIIFIVSIVSGCSDSRFGGTYKFIPIAENIRKVEWYDINMDRLPREDIYQVKIEGDWYEANLSVDLAPESEEGYMVEHFELTRRAKQRLRDYRHGGGDGGGGSDW